MAETVDRHDFQAETQRVLDIVINSLYTDKEVFLRELVSNASDSLEKLRHLQIENKEIYDDKLDLEINITTDDTAGTITIQDFGVGMTQEELVENLGTIAHSGSKAFLQAMEQGGNKGENLIGQFGVGFYSVFMVAKEVKVYTHSWQPEGESLLWRSNGQSYSIEKVDTQRRGAKIVIQLKDEHKEFAKKERVNGILKHYSSFVNFPLNLNGERVNTVQALWARNKSEITDEEYEEFYKFQANAFDKPMMRLHFTADAPLAINALLFVPEQNTEIFGMGRMEPKVGLYCRKVLIDQHPEGLLPEWLRFLRGVVDSADLPLNISRETMQDSALVRKLSTVLTKRFLKMVEKTADKDADKFKAFYKQYANYLKEGISTDFDHREQLSKLIRYESSTTEPGETTSLADYVSRMGEDQKEIYYIHAPSRKSIEEGPYLEAFKSKNLEVLFLYEPVDEYVMNNLGEFDGKRLVAADTASVEADDSAREAAAGEPLSEEESQELCGLFKDTLAERVEQVSPSKRLVGSPAIAINKDEVSSTMRRVLKAMGQQDDEELGAARVNLELNAKHPLMRNVLELKKAGDEETAKLAIEQVYDNAMIAAGFNEDPRAMVNRVYRILEQLTRKKS